jgi:hypothetical protein
MKCKVISQKMLSTECWSVQVWGTGVCEDCDYRGTRECGGKEILNTGRNVLGHRIPLPDVSNKYEEAL